MTSNMTLVLSSFHKILNTISWVLLLQDQAQCFLHLRFSIVSIAASVQKVCPIKMIAVKK